MYSLLLDLLNEEISTFKAAKEQKEIIEKIDDLKDFIFLEEKSITNEKAKITVKKATKKNFMTPFYGWGSTASRLEPLRGGSLLFTSKFPEIPGTHFIDLGRMKG